MSNGHVNAELFDDLVLVCMVMVYDADDDV
jgi:hypothetical protein